MSTFHTEIEQYSDEWWELRRGRFTGSTADKIITPTGRESSQYKAEIGRLIAEKMGIQDVDRDNFSSFWMDRGSEMEQEARAWLAVETGQDIQEIGFVSMGQHCGTSPDGLIRLDPFVDRGGRDRFKLNVPCEIKVPKPGTHISWLLDGVLPQTHKAQVHFHMICCEAPYAYFMSYHPEVEPLCIKVERDDYTLALYDLVQKAVATLQVASVTVTGEEI